MPKIMRQGALVLLALLAPIAEVIGFGAFLGRLVARLPALLRPLSKVGEVAHLLGHIGAEFLELHKTDYELQESDVADVYGIAMGPAPGPMDLIPNPNDNITGYTGPGISGNTEFSANSTIYLTCGNCSCTFDWKADFYGKTIGCTTKVKKFSCSCERSSCTSMKIAQCLKNLASGNCTQHLQQIKCL
ncbi:uncharacterized protein LOC119448249 [Dermacentor silvarum]|uniref:uncharacterized protein LOC119448249 n=1 Tax=Dermacentor silvarum TaxID=543639 RepID=UPI00189C4375|nr:uncharacterized protein LOC119448249 [Dermacentor silvarum]